MPLMRGWFAPPCTTSPTHATEQVKGAAEGWVGRRRQVTRSAVSGKSLARAPYVVVVGTNAGAIVPAASTSSDWHLRCIAVLGRLRVESQAGRCRSSVMASAYVAAGSSAERGSCCGLGCGVRSDVLKKARVRRLACEGMGTLKTSAGRLAVFSVMNRVSPVWSPPSSSRAGPRGSTSWRRSPPSDRRHGREPVGRPL